VTACIVCVPRGEEQPHEAEMGWRVCWNARRRLEAALRAIPQLVDELAGLGYVERDVRPGTRAVRVGGKLSADGQIIRVPYVADPVANLLAAGPLNGSKGAPRVSGSTDRPVPIRIDPTDLLASARPGSLAVAETGLYASDQIGHLAVATELEFWARDWADTLGHHVPLPTVHVLAGWLADRLDWACATHPALDEFAGKLHELRRALAAAAGHLDARPETLSAPCPGCGLLSLYRDDDLERVACGGDCEWLWTDEEYAGYARTLIKEAS
jgi:hypothetical protein